MEWGLIISNSLGDVKFTLKQQTGSLLHGIWFIMGVMHTH